MVIQNKYDVIIMGAGLAGIACAIRLRKKGKTVLVIEKNETFGGKLAELRWKDYRWDKGPSLFTEPNLIEELFELCGKSTTDYFQYEQQDKSCSYYFSDLQNLTLYNEHKKLDKELSKVVAKNDQNAYYQYIQSSKELYDLAGDFFISNPIPKANDLFKPSMLKRYPTLLKRQIRKSLHQHNAKVFEDDKLIQLFDRFGTYNGSNPYKMSGLYSMVSHLELDNGTYAPTKGMRSIVQSLYNLSLEIGVAYAFNETAIASSKEGGYLLEGVNQYVGESLVCAIDHTQFYAKVLKDPRLEKKYKKRERSTSGLVLYWAMNTTIPQMGLHNLFFGQDYQKESEALWNKKENCSDPSIYINISSKVNPTDAPQNGENWFVMVNTPAGIPSTEGYRELVTQRTIERIKDNFGIDISDKIQHSDYWDSTGIEEETGSFEGAIYGASSNQLSSALKRHKNKSSNYKNLYFCGGTVHPGGGIPLVLRSSKIVANYFK
jgi:phytoene desaturase